MKDPYAILQEKERDLERVRKEIHALLIVIPLIAEDNSSPHIVHEMILNSAQNIPEPETSMRELERYYPFLRHSRT